MFGTGIGDGRTFDEPGSSRVTQTVSLDVGSLVATVNAPSVSASSTIFTYPNGYVITSTHAGSSSAVGATVTEVRDGNNEITEIVITFSGNPTNPTVKGAPGITYNFAVRYNVSGNYFSVDYEADRFPSYQIKLSTGLELLRLRETTPWALTPIWPNQSGTVTTLSYPYLMATNYYSDVSNFLVWVPTSEVLAPPPDSPDSEPPVKFGPLILHDYKDSNGVWRSWQGG